MVTGANTNTARAQCNATPCAAGFVEVHIQIITDAWGSEISWVINDLTTGLAGCGVAPYGDPCGATSSLASNTTYDWYLCFPECNSMQFIIGDSYGDGGATYSVDVCGGTVVASGSGNYGCGETSLFSIPCSCSGGGGSCTGSTPSCASPPPGDCNSSCTLGTLNTPSACPDETPVSNNFCLTNIGATASNPYTYIPNCQGSGTDMPLFAADVWYSFVATGGELDIDVIGMTDPSFGLYTGSCSQLQGIGCVNGTGGTASATFSLLNPGQTYFIQISGASTSDTGNFELVLTSYNNCDACLLGANIVATPPPVSNTYQAGETVNFCFNVTEWNNTSLNWLHGVTPVFGSGWDMSTLVVYPPASCDGNGDWDWYTSVTGSATGTTAGPGFFYDSPANGTPMGVTYPNNDPGDNYGDNCVGTVNFNFCWDITVADCPPNTNGEDLSIIVSTWGDGETGSWSSLACDFDASVPFAAIAVCCFPPTVDSTDVTCYGMCEEPLLLQV